jgi:HSP20 family molecular chaperone IbpA
MAAKKETHAGEKSVVVAPPSEQARELVFKPSVDIFENEREIILVADMPGVAADDMTIEFHNGLLTIAGNVRPWENAEESDILVEFEIGRYARRFRLPEAVDHEKIDARYTDGALRLTLPKLESSLPRNIEVKVG